MCSLDHPGNYPRYLGILGYLDRGRLVCSVFLGPSRELPWVLGVVGSGGVLGVLVDYPHTQVGGVLRRNWTLRTPS